MEIETPELHLAEVLAFSEQGRLLPVRRALVRIAREHGWKHSEQVGEKEGTGCLEITFDRPGTRYCFTAGIFPNRICFSSSNEYLHIDTIHYDLRRAGLNNIEMLIHVAVEKIAVDIGMSYQDLLRRLLRTP